MVYLLCFNSKLKHAKHYIGYTKTPDGLEPRMEKHRKGTGSKLMAAVAKAGIDFVVTRMWPNGDQTFERMLKNKKNSKYLCPNCTPNIKAVQYVLHDIETLPIDASNSSTLPNSSTLVIIEDSYVTSNPLTYQAFQVNHRPWRQRHTDCYSIPATRSC
jgi:predicted GIY-YIG superfamily endonuclease